MGSQVRMFACSQIETALRQKRLSGLDVGAESAIDQDATNSDSLIEFYCAGTK